MLDQIVFCMSFKKKALRLVLLSLVFTFVVSGQLLGTVVSNFDRSNVVVNSMAWVLDVAFWWSAAGIPFPDPIYAYEASTCPNGIPVLNEAQVHGAAGASWIYGRTKSTITTTGLTRSALAVGYISPFDHPRATTILNEDTPLKCYEGLGGGGGGGGGGGYEDEDCSYCEANWTWDAACSGPGDREYCGGLEVIQQ